jgi:hypothetical protein
MSYTNNSAQTNSIGQPLASQEQLPPTKPSSKKPTTRDLIEDMEKRLIRYIDDRSQKTVDRIEQLRISPTTTPSLEERLIRYINDMEQRTAWHVEQLNNKLAQSEAMEERLTKHLYWLQNRLEVTEKKINTLRAHHQHQIQVARRNIVLVLVGVFAVIFYWTIFRPAQQKTPVPMPQKVIPQPQSLWRERVVSQDWVAMEVLTSYL